MKKKVFFLSNTHCKPFISIIKDDTSTARPFGSGGRSIYCYVAGASRGDQKATFSSMAVAPMGSYCQWNTGTLKGIKLVKRLKLQSGQKPNMFLSTYNSQFGGRLLTKQKSHKLFFSLSTVFSLSIIFDDIYAPKPKGFKACPYRAGLQWAKPIGGKSNLHFHKHLIATNASENHIKSGLKGFLSDKTNNKYNPSAYWNQCFDKGRLKNFVLWFFLNHGEYKTVQLVEQLKNIGFEYATKAGISLGIEDLKIPPKKGMLIHEAEQITSETVQQYTRGDITGVERFQRLIDTWHRTSEQLKQEVIDNFEATDILNPVYMMAFSGARGNISQVRQLVGMRGLMANPQGQIIDFPIRSNFREGLTLTEYIISSYGARKGIVDTALRTANAGYLTRRLVDVAQHVIISNFDCGTRRGIFLSDMKEGNKTILSLQTRLVGRVCARDITVNGEKIAKRNSEISIDLAYNISKVTKKVFVRSALTCETKKLVCQLCYGWSLAQGNLVAIGEAIGVIAAQSIGEPGTQLTMRTFHTGGVFSGDISDQIRMPFNGIINFNSPIPGTLIRTPEGKIAFLTKSSGSFTVLKVPSKEGTSLQISDEVGKATVATTSNQNPTILTDSKDKNHRTQMNSVEGLIQKKFKIPEYTLLFVRHGEFASEKEVVAQISSISKQKNATDDAEITIKSELEGAFYLQRLRLKENQVGPKLSQKDKQNISVTLTPTLTVKSSKELLKAQLPSKEGTLKRDSVSPLKRVSPMDSIFTAWNWGNAWILSGKVYQSPQPSMFFPKIGDYLNKRSSIIISKTNNSFSNISGLVKLKSIGPSNPINLKNREKSSTQIGTKLSIANKNSFFNSKSGLPVYHFEFLSFQLSSIIYKKFGYFTKVNWSTAPRPYGFKACPDRAGLQWALPISGISVGYANPLKNCILTKNDSLFVIPPNGQVLLKKNLLKLYPSNWQSNSILAAQWFPSVFQTTTANNLVLEKISKTREKGLKGLVTTNASENGHLQTYFNPKVMVMKPVTVKKTKPTFTRIIEKLCCLKEINFVTNTKNLNVGSSQKREKLVKTNLTPRGYFSSDHFQTNFSRILSIPHYSDKPSNYQSDFEGTSACQQRHLESGLKDITSHEIVSKMLLNLKNKQKNKDSFLNTTKINLIHTCRKSLTNLNPKELKVPSKEGTFNNQSGGSAKKNSFSLVMKNYISRKPIKSKKSFLKCQSNTDTSTFLPGRAGRDLKTNVPYLSHPRILKPQVNSLSYKYIHLYFSKEITKLFKGLLFLEYDKKGFTSFKKFYTNKSLSSVFNQICPNPNNFLNSKVFISNNSEKSNQNRNSFKKPWIYCLPKGIPNKKTKLAHLMSFSNKLVYPGQFINSDLCFDQHIVSVKPFLMPTLSNYPWNTANDAFGAHLIPNVKPDLVRAHEIKNEGIQYSLPPKPLGFKSWVGNNNCRFKKQSKYYSQLALKITKVNEFFINSLNVNEFCNLKNSISQLNQFNPDPTTTLVIFNNPGKLDGSKQLINRAFSSFKDKNNYKNFFVNKQKISPELLPKYPGVDFHIIPNFSFLKETKSNFFSSELAHHKDSKLNKSITDSLVSLPNNKKSKSLFSFFIAFQQSDVLSKWKVNTERVKRDSSQNKEHKESNLKLLYPFKEYKFDFSPPLKSSNFSSNLIENTHTWNESIPPNKGTYSQATWLNRPNTKTKNVQPLGLLTRKNLNLLNLNSVFKSPIFSGSLIHNLETPFSQQLKLKQKNNTIVSSAKAESFNVKFYVNPSAKGQYSSSLVPFSKTYSYCPFEGEVLHITSPFHNSLNFSQNAFSHGRPMVKGIKNTLKLKKVNSFYQLLDKESSFLKIQQHTCMILTKSDLISFYLPLSKLQLMTSSPEGVKGENPNTLLNPLQSYVVKPTFVTLSFELIKKLTSEVENPQISEGEDLVNKVVYKLPLISSGFPKQGVQIKKRSTSIYLSGLNKKKQKQVRIKKQKETNFAFLLGDFIVSGDSLLLHSNSIKEKLTPNPISSPVEKLNTHLASYSLKTMEKKLVKSAVTKSGQIIHLNKEKVTLRKGQPLFISPKSILHKFNGDFIEPKSPIITLSYQRLKTGDIVQGIPKIEQFFEARTTKRGRLFRDSLPNLVKALYKRYCQKLPLDKAVRQSFYKIQQIIVDGVLRVYRSQGVTIADKHLEIIVKQMTSKVRILEGGQTGFFPGEIVDLEFVEQVNELLMKKIQYEPLVLGITKSSLEVDSFLSAASFQQTTRVLSGAAISRKKDFLKGLKENVILGNLIPAGTGYLVYLTDFYSNKF
uniref:DNA-directed RNA polymerase subunit beta'' n=1 Tax=Phacotus lenticularis TaxID=52965 RepID=A0A0S2LQ77_9CHLO|nr:beta'' subunit of RNA polymerase [Phacotus lenticularis]ALO63613.1 beta'' subunit of RNA polymerase [Phacotus lenticularis]